MVLSGYKKVQYTTGPFAIERKRWGDWESGRKGEYLAFTLSPLH